jgi:hypothetical protein
MNEMSMVYQGKEKGSGVILQDCAHIMLNSKGEAEAKRKVRKFNDGSLHNDKKLFPREI